MRPYPGRKLTADKKMYNNRLSSAKRIIDNCFGILVSRWRVLKKLMTILPDEADKIILAAIALHNFIKLNDTEYTYIPPNYVDWEDSDRRIHNGDWRQEVDGLDSIRLGWNNATRAAFNSRDTLKDYFCLEGGAVPFQ